MVQAKKSEEELKFETTDIEGVILIQPVIFDDGRGHFFESYSKRKWEEYGLDVTFLQDNQSLSQKGVLRGLHFQKPPHAQAKLVRVIKGSVQDVVVDIRTSSPTFGRHISVELSEHNKTQLYVPEGFAHGFLTLEDNTIFSYKCSNFYHQPSEGAILWNDNDLGIKWALDDPILSDKDLDAPSFSELKSIF